MRNKIRRILGHIIIIVCLAVFIMCAVFNTKLGNSHHYHHEIAGISICTYIGIICGFSMLQP